MNESEWKSHAERREENIEARDRSLICSWLPCNAGGVAIFRRCIKDSQRNAESESRNIAETTHCTFTGLIVRVTWRTYKSQRVRQDALYVRAGTGASQWGPAVVPFGPELPSAALFHWSWPRRRWGWPDMEAAGRRRWAGCARPGRPCGPHGRQWMRTW